MKCKLLDDVLKIIIPRNFPPSEGSSNNARRTVNVEDVDDTGDFHLLIDEFKNPNAANEGWVYCPGALLNK